MRSKHLTAESEMRGIAYAIGIHAQDVAQSFIEHGLKVQIISPNKNLGMLDNSWGITPQIRDLVFPLIEPKENHPYGWYRKFEKKKR